VTVRFIAETEDVDYRFQFDKIPLPLHASMPEQLPALAFSSHAAPISLEFLKMAGEPDFPKVELRAVNHSNKTVRRLEMKLVFLDAKGSRLKESPGGTADLVPANTSAVLQTNAFFAPKETHRVEAEIDCVEFADATQWKPHAGAPTPGK
jgi:hypothetical protein